MPFGKYKGTSIRDLPTEYIRFWMLPENSHKIKDPLIMMAMTAVLEERENEK